MDDALDEEDDEVLDAELELEPEEVLLALTELLEETDEDLETETEPEEDLEAELLPEEVESTRCVDVSDVTRR